MVHRKTPPTNQALQQTIAQTSRNRLCTSHKPTSAICYRPTASACLGKTFNVPTLALIVAAGRGERATSERTGNAQALPKQYVNLAGRPVLAHTLRTFIAHSGIDAVQVVIHVDDRALYQSAISRLDVTDNQVKLLPPAIGGPSRQTSVHNGLEAAKQHGFDAVLIHDAARPLLPPADIDALLGALAKCPAAILAAPVTDTLKRASGASSHIEGTVSRDHLWRALTPQAFRFDQILQAYRAASETTGNTFTDDASVAQAAGIPVALIEGQTTNIKITTPEDFDVAEQLIARTNSTPPQPDVRTGQGFDVHKFAEGTSVWLCGVEIPHDYRLEGHSDADVGLHALTDAILGALADGDIGAHFPPSDPRWKGAASEIFLIDAMDRVRARGASITNLDITLICEAPKIGPHRDRIRARLAEITALETDRISVKATTSEGLGFTGRREGIAALATATLVF